jgi:hypothetical protein
MFVELTDKPHALDSFLVLEAADKRKARVGRYRRYFARDEKRGGLLDAVRLRGLFVDL